MALKKAKKTVDSTPVWIGKRGGLYVAYLSLANALLGTVSPSIMSAYSQNALKHAYETGNLKGDL